MPTNLTQEEVQQLWTQYDIDLAAYVTALESRQDISDQWLAHYRGEVPSVPGVPVPQRPLKPTRPVPPRPSVD